MEADLIDELGVIADIHGNALALQAVVEHAHERGVERFVNLGDILYGPLQPLATYNILQQMNVVATIAGNEDRRVFAATPEEISTDLTLAFVIEQLGPGPSAWLRSLPATAAVDDDFFLCHGTPASDTTYLLEDVSRGTPTVRDEQAILRLLEKVRQPTVLCGHSHLPRLVRLAGGQMIVNPGSVGLPAYSDDAPLVHVMETHASHASYATVRKGQSGWDVCFHRVDYPWDLAAKQALERNRTDWAHAIATGRVR